MIKEIPLYRITTGDQGTRGLLIDRGFKCCTLELPWRNNKRNYSCIPDGIYDCKYVLSGKFGWCYHIQNVPNRNGILIHSGNLAGDRTKGFRTDSYGCILPGKYNGLLYNQQAVLVSRTTLRRFISHMNNEDFRLNIINFIDGGFLC